MKKVGIFWGSSSGNTEIAIEFMVEYLEAEGFEVDNFDVGEVDAEKMLEYDNLIIGCPTWNIGELQDDWDSIFLQYKELDFGGKTAAFFGCGDAVGYPDNFLDAIGILAKPFMEKGGKHVVIIYEPDTEMNLSMKTEFILNKQFTREACTPLMIMSPFNAGNCLIHFKRKT